MQIQFDPFSFVVATIAVILSGRAYVLSKRAPHAERVRQNRDVVRGALRDVADVLRDLRTELDEGREVGEVPPQIDAAFSVLEEYGPRLPERNQVWLIQRAIFVLRSEWRSAVSNAARVGSMEQEVTLWEVELANPGHSEKVRATLRHNLSQARSRQNEVRRVLDAALTKLRESVKPVEYLGAEYVKMVDAQERGGAK